MPDRDPPALSRKPPPSFPRPHTPEAPSPYRARIAPPAPPPEPAPRLVTRPDPPLDVARPAPRFTGDLGLLTPPPPLPAGPLDELARKLHPLTTFVGNHPFLCGVIVLLLAALYIALGARSAFGDGFVIV